MGSATLFREADLQKLGWCPLLYRKRSRRVIYSAPGCAHSPSVAPLEYERLVHSHKGSAKDYWHPSILGERLCISTGEHCSAEISNLESQSTNKGILTQHRCLAGLPQRPATSITTLQAQDDLTIHKLKLFIHYMLQELDHLQILFTTL